MAGILLKGKTAFLTGAASGLGKATAIGLAKYGIQNLALTDVNHHALAETLDEIRRQSPNVNIEAMQLNVTDEAQVNQTVLRAAKAFGRIDVGINFAGISGVGNGTHETDEIDWLKVIDVNLNGMWRSQRAVLSAMMKQENLGQREGRGSIINVSSMYGIIGMPANISATPYTASKTCGDWSHQKRKSISLVHLCNQRILLSTNLSKQDASNYAAHGIRINAICPGYVSTPLLVAAESAGKMKDEVNKTPMQRMGQLDEISDCIAFMASPMSSFMTGHALIVDGGYTVV